jgi:hypothetical protein
MENEAQIYAAMQTGTPLATYKKTILGKVEVKILDSFRGVPTSVILEGNPTINSEGCFIDAWSEKEDVYIKRMNTNHLKSGVLISWNRSTQPAAPEGNPFNQLSDEELFELINSPFFKLQNAMNKMDNSAPVSRLLAIAEQEDKSEKLVKAIRGRLAELQEMELNARIGSN